jgi:putative ABC transport system permease protein
MSLRAAILEALASLSSNKLRSGLTVLGIVIGVGAVIAMLGIGRGAQATITGSIGDIGTNLLFVFDAGSDEVRNPKPLTMGDAQAIGDPFQAPSVDSVAPILTDTLEVTYGGESTFTQALGVTAAYESVRNVDMAEGAFFSEEHMLGRAAVAVLAPDTAERLFDRTEGLVGETIRIEGQPFRILGVTVARGGSGFNNEDDRVLVPLTTAQSRLMRRGRGEVDMIMASATSAETVTLAHRRSPPCSRRATGRDRRRRLHDLHPTGFGHGETITSV